jgi:hypothetical protein
MYSVSNTLSDLQNYATCSYTFSGTSLAIVTASVCNSYVGDTYLRAYINGTQVASNDDYCSTGSLMTFGIANGQTVVIREGCYSNNYCNGTVVMTFSSTVSFSPTVAPTRLPTQAQPTRMPTQAPTPVPTYLLNAPTPVPTRLPTILPTQAPTPAPTVYRTPYELTTSPQVYWSSITMDSTGSYLAATQYYGDISGSLPGNIYLSSDGSFD